MRALMVAIFVSASHILVLAVVWTMFVLDVPLVSSSLFKMISFFLHIELVLVFFVPLAIQNSAETSVTLQRIQVDYGGEFSVSFVWRTDVILYVYWLAYLNVSVKLWFI